MTQILRQSSHLKKWKWQSRIKDFIVMRDGTKIKTVETKHSLFNVLGLVILFVSNINQRHGFRNVFLIRRVSCHELRMFVYLWSQTPIFLEYIACARSIYSIRTYLLPMAV